MPQFSTLNPAFRLLPEQKLAEILDKIGKSGNRGRWPDSNVILQTNFKQPG